MAYQSRITIPTMLTLTRIALIPVIIYAMHVQCWFCALFLFSVAVMTDVLDGYLARRLAQQTLLGACLDPIADKLLIVSLFFMFMYFKNPFMPAWFVWLVSAKESIQLAGAGVIFLSTGALVVRPSLVGKLSMFLQTGFIFVLLAGYLAPTAPTKYPGLLEASLLWSITVLLGVGLVQYVFVGITQLLK